MLFIIQMFHFHQNQLLFRHSCVDFFLLANEEGYRIFDNPQLEITKVKEQSDQILARAQSWRVRVCAKQDYIDSTLTSR